MTNGLILKIKLNGIRPPIWRRFWVPKKLTLSKLHEVVQYVMGWDNYHLYLFNVLDVSYGVVDHDFNDDMARADKKWLKDVFTDEGDKIDYKYDFGDGWTHEIKLEKEEKSEKQTPYVIAGKRACPPEDCGGVQGYQNILHVLAKTRRNAEDKELLEWLGDYDPEAFDVDELNENFPRRT